MPPWRTPPGTASEPGRLRQNRLLVSLDQPPGGEVAAERVGHLLELLVLENLEALLRIADVDHSRANVPLVAVPGGNGERDRQPELIVARDEAELVRRPHIDVRERLDDGPLVQDAAAGSCRPWRTRSGCSRSPRNERRQPRASDDGHSPLKFGTELTP